MAPAQAPVAGDDLKRIRGIGPEIEAALHKAGIRRYTEIAGWSAGDVDAISKSLGLKGRVEHENWIEQSQVLAKGGETAFSRRYDRGDMETVPAPAAAPRPVAVAPAAPVATVPPAQAPAPAAAPTAARPATSGTPQVSAAAAAAAAAVAAAAAASDKARSAAGGASAAATDRVKELTGILTGAPPPPPPLSPSPHRPRLPRRPRPATT